MYSLPPLIFSIYLLFLGFLVFFKSDKNKLQRAFIIFTICTALWQLFLALLYSCDTAENAHLITKAGYSLVIIVPFVYFYYLQNYFKGKHTLENAVYLLVVILQIALLTFTDNYITHCRATFFGFYPVPGKYYILFCLLTTWIAFRSLLEMILTYKNTPIEGLNKKKILYNAISLSIFCLAALDLLVKYQISDIYPYSAIFVPISMTIFSYAILKHQLFDINLAIKRSASFSILFALLLSIMMALNNYLITKLQLPLIWNMTIFVVIGITSYEFLYRSIDKITENIFIKKKHNFRDIIDLSENLEQEQAISQERKKYSELLQEKNEELAVANLELLEMIEKEKKAQQIIVSQSKEAVIGRIAGGIAHEFKNPLAMQLELIENLKDDPELIYHFYDRAKQSISHCFDITRVLLNSFHSKEVKHTTLDLSEIINETIILFEMSIKNSNIEIETDLKPCKITGSRADLQQVIMNILSNAKDAIANIGTINISLKEKDNNTTLEISDNGCGMNQETMKNIYDPFFTTKEVGSGTGIGLYLVKQILDKHQATIECTSSIDTGSTFTIGFTN